jgi:hypothetical protein
MRRSSLLLIGLTIVTACSGPEQEFIGPWLRPSGQPAGDDYRAGDGFTMASYRGAEHCDWETAVFLEMAWPPGSVLHASDDSSEGSTVRWYVRDPDDVLDFDAGGFSSDAELPSDAEPTGFTRGSWELWTSQVEEGYAFLVSEGRVERWPESDQPACA